MGSGIDGSGEHARRSQSARRAAKKAAVRRQCKAYGRKMATTKHVLDGGLLIVRKCRPRACNRRARTRGVAMPVNHHESGGRMRVRG